MLAIAYELHKLKKFLVRVVSDENDDLYFPLVAVIYECH